MRAPIGRQAVVATLGAATALAVASACGADPAGPAKGLVGSYVLETYDARPGPPWTRVLGPNWTYRLDSAALLVRADGTYLYGEYVQHTPLDRPPFDSYVGYHGSYASVWGGYRFATDGAADACTANCFLATTASGGLTWTDVDGRRSTFRRID